MCSAFSLIVWKGHVKGDWEKVRCLHHSGVHIFHQTVVHSLRLLSCYRAAFQSEGEILFQIIGVNKSVILTVWRQTSSSAIYASADTGPISTAINVDAEMCFIKWDAFT